jgi:membrane-bound ClpP family serine protease
MSFQALLDPRAIRAAVVLFLVAFALIATVAMAAAASSPKVLPVEPDGGIGGEIVLPVEPDGGIGN